jgi:hypothetical protein
MALDPSIFNLVGRGVKSVNDYDMEAAQLDNARTAGQANKLALVLNRQKADEYTRGVAEQNALRQALAGATTTEDRIERARRTGTGAGFALAAGEEKGLLERQKTASQIAKEASEQKAKDYETGRKAYEHRISGLSQFQDAEGAKQWLADSVHKGALSMEEATRMIKMIPAGDPAAFAQWKNDTIFSLQDAAKQAGYIKPDANATLSANTSAANNAATNARLAAEGAANREVTKRGQDIQKEVQRSAQQLKADLADEKKAVGKPMPATALKMQQEALDAIGISKSISADMDSLIAQLSPSTNAAGAKVPPALQLGPVENLLSTAKNATGFSDKNSKNYNSAKASLEKLRNDSLRLNKGVQTEGDSQRAWNELVNNLNDQENVKQRLSEIREINERAARLHQANVDVVRNNYGLEPLDMDAYLNQVPAVGAKKGPKTAAPSTLGMSSRVGGQAPRPAAAPAAPAAPVAAPKFLGFE